MKFDRKNTANLRIEKYAIEKKKLAFQIILSSFWLKWNKTFLTITKTTERVRIDSRVIFFLLWEEYLQIRTKDPDPSLQGKRTWIRPQGKNQIRIRPCNINRIRFFT